jgi:tetratricopeptide (TPR) repeat protein
MGKNKTGTYFKYAFGEIVLVVIGILIALQVSNWNQLRLEKNTMNAYYAKLTNTLEDDIKELRESTDELNSLGDDLKRCLEILNTENEADIEELKAKIGALNTPFANEHSMELFEEFMNKGYLSKIEDTELKSQFERVKIGLIRAENWDKMLDNDFVNNVTPFIQNNLNYVDIKTSFKGSDKKDRPKGGPKVDYTRLFNNLKAWNAIHGRLDHLRFTTKINNKMLEALTELKATIERVLSEFKSLNTLKHQGKTADEIIAVVKEQDRENPDYNISEISINELGYSYMNTLKHNSNALKVFKLNTELYPDAFNTHDSYGECLLLMGDTENAIKAYKKSLELNPENENAVKMLKELKVEN